MGKNISDFTTLHSCVKKVVDDNSLESNSDGFMFLAMDLLLNLQTHEIEDSITDSNFLKNKKKQSGHERGIDAIYIDNNDIPCKVHLFNFKYTEKFANTEKNFPSNEIDKILVFFQRVFSQDANLKSEINSTLFEKVKEIWKIQKDSVPTYTMHLCSNYYSGLTQNELNRFTDINKYNCEIAEHTILDFVKLTTQKGKRKVNAKIKAIDRQFFLKGGSDIRALIVNLDVRELIKMVIDDLQIRSASEITNYAKMKDYKIIEDAFEDNVRIYLKTKLGGINLNIKNTALSDENHRFFYFNNGITITCEKFTYAQELRNPTIELNNIQIVNGGQTVHALYEAFCEKPDKFQNVEILCRIYETTNDCLSLDIATYTNSQNPVKSRDIRSNDFIQLKIETELLNDKYYFERKKGQYQSMPKTLRIDAELAGQLIMAFYLNNPADAKNKKRLIFGTLYEDIFSKDRSASEILLVFLLFNRIQEEIKTYRKKHSNNSGLNSINSFVLHSSFYILYTLKKLAQKDNVQLHLTEIDLIWKNYNKAKQIIMTAVKREKKLLEKSGELYSHRIFFVGNKPKKYIDKQTE